MDSACSEFDPSDPLRGIDEVSRSALSFDTEGRGVGGGPWFMCAESQEADGLAFLSQAERVVWSTGQACSGGGGRGAEGGDCGPDIVGAVVGCFVVGFDNATGLLRVILSVVPTRRVSPFSLYAVQLLWIPTTTTTMTSTTSTSLPLSRGS